MNVAAREPSLRAVRAQKSAFDGRFCAKSPVFWPIARAARSFEGARDWPRVEDYARVFDEPERAPVRFVVGAAKSRRWRRTSAPSVDTMYDARIVAGEVPTRPGSWHDFANALVWGTFPRAKRALHARQHAVVRAWVPEGASRLPNARTREHDALALIDEGGVLETAAGPVVFGHALYEGLALGVRAMVARAIALPTPGRAPADLASLDACFAAWLAEEPLLPERLPRVSLADVAARTRPA
ncbi:MAG: DUF3025 domain-containing protein [Polyangiaceae bacterium]